MPCLGNVYFSLDMSGGRGVVRRRAGSFLGDTTVNTPCPPPPFQEVSSFWGVDKRCACPCLVDAATVKHLLPHSQGRVACPALPPVIFVLYCWGIIYCFSPCILTIIVFPPTNTVCAETPSSPTKEFPFLFSSAIIGSR